MNEAFFARGHAGFCRGLVTIGDGFADFVDGRILHEILLKTGIAWCEGHGRCSIAVVNDIKRGQQEGSFLPGPPLVVAVHRANTHVHGRTVDQLKA